MAGRRVPHLYAAVYMMIRKGEDILMLRRHNTGFMDGWYSLPAGHLRSGERVASAAVREAMEETAVTIEEKDIRVLSMVHRNIGKREYIDFFVEAQAWKGEVSNPEPDKCSELRFFPLNALPDNTIDYVRKGIESSMARVPFAEHGWTPSSEPTKGKS